MIRIIWMSGGLTALALAGAGVILPLLPTTPFVLLAAFCFARSSPRLHNWLMDHRHFGPLIRNWGKSGALAPKVKAMAMATIAATMLLSVWLSMAPIVLIVQGVVLSGAAAFILTRPSTTQAN